MDFAIFKQAIAKQFERLSKHELFTAAISKDDLWDTYLAAFPEGTNPIYKTRTEHDCQCCKQFIRAVGNVVAIIDGHIESIWSIEIEDEVYQLVANAMADAVESKSIDNCFLHYERTAGTDRNFQDLLEGKVKRWDHFFVNIPSRFVCDDIGPKLSDLKATFDVMKRGITTITFEAIGTVQELIAQKSLYRGEEHLFAVTEFQKLKLASNAQANEKLSKGIPVEYPAHIDLFAWSKVKSVPTSVSRIRNTSIGTLLVDLSEGVELDRAVASFEAKVAPANYKRPTALVTKSMIEAAKKTIEELGLTSALERRYATIDDITINNILFADRSAPKTLHRTAFDDIAQAINVKPKSLDKIEQVNVAKFLSDILPKAESIEVMVENRHLSNFVSLIAPSDQTAAKLFKWDNKFSWSYNGEMADSIKERVKQAGGNVTGELCCRLAWEYKDDLDFHMVEPDNGHIYFSTRRHTSRCGGQLDVDANGMNGMMEHPVENIFYQSLKTMKEGIYHLSVNNYSRRSDGVGFEVEIDIQGTIHHIVYDKVLKNGDTKLVAKLEYSKTKGLTILESLPSTQAVRQVWGVNTNAFQKVEVVMMSPNFWDDQGVGNKHLFFMLQGCRNGDKARGFFNEFLISDLDKHRKVIEMVGSKMKTDEADRQLSGLGFSSTQANSLVCRVTGNFTRIIKIVF